MTLEIENVQDDVETYMICHKVSCYRCNQKDKKTLHNFWAYDILYHKIANKAEEYGINMERQTEEYTSQTCPVCSVAERGHKKDRIFVCSFCDFFGHRDLVGATNIMLNGMHSQLSVHQAETSLLGGCENAIN